MRSIIGSALGYLTINIGYRGRYVKYIIPIFSALSLLFSIWLFRKTLRLLDSQHKHLIVDQSRFIDDMWQKSNALILSDNQYVGVIKDLFGYASNEDVIKTYVIFNIINPLYVSYKCMKDGVMTPHIFEVTRDNILSNFSGDRKELVAIMRKRGYIQDFVDKCENYLTSCPPKI